VTPLTDQEARVWALAYVHRRDDSSHEYDRECAIEFANEAVEDFRSAPGLIEARGKSA
jgi:hypothetical protein